MAKANIFVQSNRQAGTYQTNEFTVPALLPGPMVQITVLMVEAQREDPTYLVTLIAEVFVDGAWRELGRLEHIGHVVTNKAGAKVDPSFAVNVSGYEGRQARATLIINKTMNIGADGEFL